MSQTKDIRDAIERGLNYDPLVDDSDISVKNINGDVALNGTVPSYPQYLEAAAAARRRWPSNCGICVAPSAQARRGGQERAAIC